MKSILESIFDEVVRDEASLNYTNRYQDSEEGLVSEILTEMEKKSGGISCHHNMSENSGWPRCNPLLPGLAKIHREKKSYKDWVKKAWLHTKTLPRNAMQSQVDGMRYNSIKNVVNKLSRGEYAKGWSKVEARLLIPHGSGSGFWPVNATLPPGVFMFPKVGGGHYLRITDTNRKSLKGYASQAYGRHNASKGARAIDNHWYNRRYWKKLPVGPLPANSYRINIQKVYEKNLVKLHKVQSFRDPAPRGKYWPVLFLPFRGELDRLA